jgi:hypothetical protein
MVELSGAIGLSGVIGLVVEGVSVGGADDPVEIGVGAGRVGVGPDDRRLVPTSTAAIPAARPTAPATIRFVRRFLSRRRRSRS